MAYLPKNTKRPRFAISPNLKCLLRPNQRNTFFRLSRFLQNGLLYRTDSCRGIIHITFYNTFGADRAFVRDTEAAAQTAIQAAESSGLASAAQHKAEQNAQTAKAMEKQMDAYAKARLALLKKAYKAQADTAGV